MNKDYSVYEEEKLPRKLNEELLEEKYWIYIDSVKKGEHSDRDYFKYAMRSFARSQIEDYIKEQEQKEIEKYELYRRQIRHPNLILNAYYNTKWWFKNL
jgi:hypothetical protein